MLVTVSRVISTGARTGPAAIALVGRRAHVRRAVADDVVVLILHAVESLSHGNRPDLIRVFLELENRGTPNTGSLARESRASRTRVGANRTSGLMRNSRAP